MRTLTTIILLALALPLWAGEYDEAVKLIKAKKYGVAKTLLEATLKKDQSPKVHFALGYCCEKMGDEDKAVLHYRDAVALNLKDATDGAEAARALRKLMELKPEIGDLLTMAQDLETKAKERKSEFMRQAARKLYDHALDPANWNLKPKDKPEPLVNVGVSKAKIPEDALAYKGGRYKVYVAEKPIAWEDAKKRCEELGGHLVVVGDSKEMDFVRELAHAKAYLWLGAHRVGKRWKWVDGSRWNFKQWAANTDPSGEKVGFMALRTVGNGRGVTPASSPHEEVRGYICEWKE